MEDMVCNSSFTRGVWAGGQSTPGGIVNNVIEYVTIPTEGTALQILEILQLEII